MKLQFKLKKDNEGQDKACRLILSDDAFYLINFIRQMIKSRLDNVEITKKEEDFLESIKSEIDQSQLLNFYN